MKRNPEAMSRIVELVKHIERARSRRRRYMHAVKECDRNIKQLKACLKTEQEQINQTEHVKRTNAENAALALILDEEKEKS